MKIAERVEMLEVKFQQGVPQAAYYPVLLWDDKDTALIDTGFPGQLELIRAEMAKCGKKPEQVTKVIITHHDIDHIGNLKAFKGFGAQIIASETETPYVQGDKPFLKITDMEKTANKLPPERRAFYDRLKETAPQLCAKVDIKVKDGEVIPACGGIKVYATPGHTLGHIALLLMKSGIAVCGDAANIIGGKLVTANSQNTHDQTAADKSFDMLVSLKAPDGYVCYHSGYLKG